MGCSPLLLCCCHCFLLPFLFHELGECLLGIETRKSKAIIILCPIRILSLVRPSEILSSQVASIFLLSFSGTLALISSPLSAAQLCLLGMTSFSFSI
ncbi:hypothetical protein SLEP1_g31409 [Rubroshorea leprosula]|uniref:Uncharacterized protein n=1 Tax=Rubroshorea leprosula TaxID=152421 RepID=A0AAV5K3A0_9ROSI|nr:hypothetical protein SLEP1_g31409 [Rubroshorea leprosula]